MKKTSFNYSKSTFLSLIVVSILSCFLSGCGANKLGADVAILKQRTDPLPSKVEIFYSKINEIHRRIYLQEVRLNPGLEVTTGYSKNAALPDLSDEELAKLGVTREQYKNLQKALETLKNTYFNDMPAGQLFLRTGLTNFYPENYVKVRTLAASGVQSYVNKLNTLASSTAPQDAKQAIVNVRTELEGFSSQIKSLDPDNKALEFSKFSTPIANLVSIGAEKVLILIRDKWVKSSIDDTKKNFSDICQSLEIDLNNSVEGARVRSKKLLAHYGNYFNNKSGLKNKKFEDGQKAAFLNEMKSIGALQTEIEDSNPVPTIRSIIAIHKNLVEKYSKKTRNGNNQGQGEEEKKGVEK